MNDLTEKLLQSKKYGGVCPDTVRRVVRECAAKYKKEKDVEKAAREHLHGVTSAFMTESECRKACIAAENADFEARPNELVALTGASGEGKTTIIRLLLGLIKPQQGEAVLEGNKGEKLILDASTRNAFSYVPQGNTVFPGTLAENLRMVKSEATDEELWEVLRIACAESFVAKLPDGIYSNTGEVGHGFSEGQAQRIAVARALLKNASVMLLDEATSALDEVTEKEMLQNLTACGRVRTCIIVTHRPATAAICTRRYVLKGTNLEEVK